MAGIDVPANCGPLLKDPYLPERIGFTAERIQNCLAKDRTVVDTETLGANPWAGPPPLEPPSPKA